MKALLTHARTFRGFTAIALMLWCAGAGCLMVSYAREMENMEPSTVPDQMQTAMHTSMDGHGCCKAKHKSAKRAKTVERAVDLQFTQFGLPSPISSNAMSCCPLTTGSIVAGSQSQTNDDASAVLQTSSSSTGSDNSYQKPLAIPMRLPNRAHSYLLDCAFLI